jgi:hypothetical protein
LIDWWQSLWVQEYRIDKIPYGLWKMKKKGFSFQWEPQKEKNFQTGFKQL